MFIDNKYKRVYDRLIEKGLERDSLETFEKHHILPRAFGGSDDSTNLVDLTPREHFIAHMLLPKFTEGEARSKMIYAYVIMSGRKKYGVSFGSRSYQRFKEEHAKLLSESVKGSKNPLYGVRRTGKDNSFYGKTHSEESKRKMSKALVGHSRGKGIKKSDEAKANMSNGQKKYWANLSDEAKKEQGAGISRGWANREMEKCPHCGREGKANMKRYHFDNCKPTRSWNR
jgi:hypothetical protein